MSKTITPKLIILEDFPKKSKSKRFIPSNYSVKRGFVNAILNLNEQSKGGIKNA